MRKKKTKKAKTSAFHGALADGIHHLVGILNLHVVVVPDGNLWFAQGLEIDYASQGSSPKEARKQFTQGLYATIHEHLRIYGDIRNVLKAAPPVVWNDLVYAPLAIPSEFTTVKTYHVESEAIPANIQRHLPFAGIDYVEARPAA